MDELLIIKEICFTAVTSGGPGGQHANKVSSKIRLSFDLDKSRGLNEVEKGILRNRLEPKLTKDNVLILTCDKSRSQHQNKEIVRERFLQLLRHSLRPTVKRIKSKPTLSSQRKRLNLKKKNARKKELRKKPGND